MVGYISRCQFCCNRFISWNYFSIIFEKEFRNVVNMKRGCARFVDIINKYKSNSLGVFRKKSLDFIRDSLV